MFLLVRSRIFFIIVGLSVIVTFSYVWFLGIPGIFMDSVTSTKPHVLEIEQEQLRMQMHIANVCQSLNVSDSISDIPSELLDHIIVDDVHKLMYCAVPKVACTNWKRVLLVLRGVGEDPVLIRGNETHVPNLFKTLNQYSAKEVEYKVRKYLKFMFVRHPYERVLSAYRNKFENSYSNYFRVRFGIEIIKTYRKQPSSESLLKGDDVTFNEFLQYIVNLRRDNYRLVFNEHWRPISDMCFPCSIKYDIVGKYETLNEDSEYILWKAGVSDQVKFPVREQSYKSLPTVDVMHSYYKNVSKSLLTELYKTYQDDFLLFKYDHHV